MDCRNSLLSSLTVFTVAFTWWSQQHSVLLIFCSCRLHQLICCLRVDNDPKHPSLVYGQVPFIFCLIFLCSGCPHTGSCDWGANRRGCRDSQLNNYCFQACSVSLQCDDKHNGWHCWGLVQPSDHVRMCVLPLICMYTESFHLWSHMFVKYDLAPPPMHVGILFMCRVWQICLTTLSVSCKHAARKVNNAILLFTCTMTCW